MRIKILAMISLLSFLGIGSVKAQQKINWKQDLEYLKSYLEIVHPALYAYISEDEFNLDFNYLEENCENLSDAEIVIRIKELFAKIQDGHTGSDFLDKNNQYLKGLFHYYPVWLYRFSDGMYVLYAKNEHREIIGKKLLKIGNLDIDEATTQLMRLNIGDNDMGKSQRFYLIQEFLQYTGILDDNETNLVLTYEEDGEKFTYVLDQPKSTADYYFAPKVFPQKDSIISTMNDNCSKQLPMYLSHLKENGFSGENYWYTYIPTEETIYLQINSNEDKDQDPFEAFCGRMFHYLDSLKATKLIVDVRLNGGGQHFEMPLIKGIIARPSIDTKGNLFLITGRSTFSASEHLTTQMEIYTNVTIFGEPTAARPNMVGSLTPFILPNSGLKCFCASQYTQDSDYWDSRLTTKPHVYALLSSDHYKNNYDPVLDAIFTYDSIMRLKQNLTTAMQKGYKEQGIEGLRNAFYEQKHSCKNAGINFEFFLMDEFSWWIIKNRKERSDYSAYIKFVVDEMPESMRANYWYGRNCHLNNKDQLAKMYYRRCLKLNPAHSYANKYLRLLEMHEKYEIKNYG